MHNDSDYHRWKAEHCDMMSALGHLQTFRPALHQVRFAPESRHDFM